MLLPRAVLSLVLLAGCGPVTVAFKDADIGGTDGDTGPIGGDGLPDVTLSTDALDFGVVLPGDTASLTFLVGNVGDGLLEGELQQGGSGTFHVDTRALALDAGAEQVVSVSFGGGSPGGYEGSIVVRSNDPDEPALSVAIRGEVGLDEDGDGFAGSDDCDDADATVNPDATETWYDGVDQDCSGGSDFDADGDGDDAAEHGGGDCDDTDASVGPSADEVWYDGFDQDCDGRSDYDQDADGHDDADHGGDDCDDTAPTAYPGHIEEVGNGVDDDCDGTVDETLSSVDTDGDGYAETDGDCVEGDATIHPGAEEGWYDGVDQDCSGGSDFDQDGDGADSGEFGGDDCDDLDATVLPGATETWYDGLDQDCSGGSDFDQDGDGHDAVAYGGADCDDLDAATSPDAVETWYDGVDSDCSGTSDFDADADAYDAVAHGGTDCDDLAAGTHPDAEDAWYDGVDANCAGDDDYDADADGFAAEAYGGTDCDDTDGGVNPSVPEAWYDGEDSDCDGASDFDQDRDGHDEAWSGGDDCDDLDATVNPDAAEGWYDGVDQDCSGGSDYDQDADGHDADAWGGADCDDTDAAVSPDATEIWYDGRDQDCDGASDDDQDGDGFDATAAGGDDCDDTDGNRNPSAEEECDGVDQDCDGTVDEDVLPTWYVDADGDGYGSSATTVLACTAPAGYAASASDCNDASAAVSPGARETCNETDDDCDGATDEGLATSTLYRDADGDGYGDAGHAISSCRTPSGYVGDATDCDDAAAGTNPGADEAAYDAADNDCDALQDEMVAADETWWTVLGDRASDAIGSGGVHLTEDLDADDLPELVIASGYVNTSTSTDIGLLAFHNVDGAGFDMSVTDGWFEAYGNNADDYFGSAFAVLGDVDGGQEEIVVGAYQNDVDNTDDGTVYVFDVNGAWGWDYGAYMAEGAIYGDATNSWTGYSVAVGDFDGDGVNEVASGAPGEQSGKGQVYVSFLSDGFASGAIDNDSSQFWVRGVSNNDHLGYSVAIGELTGDGYDDLVACSPDDDDAGSNSGTCWVVAGASTRGTSTSVMGSTVSSVDTAVITGGAASDQLGKTPHSLSVGDFDGDTLPDLAVGLPGYDGYVTDGGAVLVYRNGTLSGSETSATAGWLVRGDGALGTAVSMTGDVTGDGAVDLLAGATTAGAGDEGVVYLLAGGTAAGTWTLPADQYASWVGETAGDLFGAAISGLQDLDGDGVLDFAVAATGNDDTASGAGKIYVLPAYP